MKDKNKTKKKDGGANRSASRRGGVRSQMKTINIAAYDIVKAGVACQSETPIRLDKLLRLMERNESYIFWLQPLNSNVQAQVPAISINGKFYHPNLKLEKAIFRHVRLSRDFDNQELLEDGTPKLRIPVRLMREKVKSSIRFQVRPRLLHLI